MISRQGSDEALLTTEARVYCKKETSLCRLGERRSEIYGIYPLLSVSHGTVRFY